VYCGHSTQYNHLVFQKHLYQVIWLPTHKNVNNVSKCLHLQVAWISMRQWKVPDSSASVTRSTSRSSRSRTCRDFCQVCDDECWCVEAYTASDDQEPEPNQDDPNENPELDKNCTNCEPQNWELAVPDWTFRLCKWTRPEHECQKSSYLELSRVFVWKFSEFFLFVASEVAKCW